MGWIKDRNGMDLTEAEDIKKRWQEYTEELYKKDLHIPGCLALGQWSIANIRWIMKKAREFQKSIYFCFIDYAKDFDCVDHNKLENSSRDGNTRPLDLPPEKSVCRSRQLQLDMEQ